MDKEVIQIAIQNALGLLHSEMESVSVDELREEYERVIKGLELALLELC